MGGVPVKHHSKSKVGRRRSQLALKKRALQKCAACLGPMMPHLSCPHCGVYSKTKKAPKTAS